MEKIDAIRTALTDAMRQRDSRRTTVLRMMLSALEDRQIALRSQGTSMNADHAIETLRSLVKKRLESARLYEQGHRPELAAQEKNEIPIIESFLPQAMDRPQIEAAVDRILKTTGASGLADMGKVLGALKKTHGHQIDMKQAGEIVRDRLR